ncbi:Uncharacterised protein [Brucella neotomae]|nr:Uncharacterised protein [Brucella neotomae]SPU67227.1 Uncharacterised protein [Brucella neotomae]SPU70351.1 Uncharacterised protein [Brucella neotomae]SUW61563.1 Uncharacterised protein [Brucella neotomae]
MVNMLSEQRDSLPGDTLQNRYRHIQDKQAALPPGRPQFPHFTPRRHPDSGLLRTLGLSCSPTLKRLGR